MNLLKKAKNVTGSVASSVAGGVSSVAGGVAGSVSTVAGGVAGGVSTVAGGASRAAGGVTSAVKHTAASGKSIASSVKHAVGNVGTRPDTFVDVAAQTATGVVFLLRPKKTKVREFVGSFTGRSRAIYFRNINSESHTAAIDLAFLKAPITTIPADPTNQGEGKSGLKIVTLVGEYHLYFRTEADSQDWLKVLSSLPNVSESQYNAAFASRLETWKELDSGNGLLASSKLRHWLKSAKGVQLSSKRFKEVFKDSSEEDTDTGVFTFSEFLELLDSLFLWEHSRQSFNRIATHGRLSLQAFQKWLETDQRETFTADEVREIAAQSSKEACEKFFAASNLAEDGSIDVYAFHQYFFSPTLNHVFDIKKRTVYQDMTRPFAYYYCNSSHNTYLLGDQLKGVSSTQAYINALLRGCRCVELDTWDGPNGQPIVTHGNTFCTKIPFRAVVETIKEYAFKASPYPVILSIENHCGLEQQVVMANTFKEVLGDMLPDRDALWANGYDALPSPEALKYKILLKGACDRAGAFAEEDEEDEENEDLSELGATASGGSVSPPHSPTLGRDVSPTQPSPPKAAPLTTSGSDGNAASGEGSGSKVGTGSSNSGLTFGMSSSGSRSSLLMGSIQPSPSSKQVKLKRAPELSALIHLATQKLRLDAPGASFEMSSFSERGIEQYANRKPVQLVKHLQRQLLRIYPKGARVDSSNYMPLTSWNVGAQIVALNFQTESKPLWLNDAKFSDNGNCGYVLKPEYMLAPIPQSPMTIETFPKSVLLVEIVSAHNLPASESTDSILDPYIVLECYGAPRDVRKFKTKTVLNNNFDPVWREQFCFPLYSPNLALLLFQVKTGADLKKQASVIHLGETKDALQNTLRQDKTTFYSSLPVSCLRQGSRVVTLKTRKSDPIPDARILINVSFYYSK